MTDKSQAPGAAKERFVRPPSSVFRHLFSMLRAMSSERPARNKGGPPSSVLRPLSSELAAPTLAGARVVWRDSLAAGLTPERLAQILQSADQGEIADFLAVAEEMEERDAHYRCEIGKRRMAVSGLHMAVESATDAAEDVALADEIRALVADPVFDDLVKGLLDALGKGFAVCEIIWRRGETWRPVSYLWRDPRFFKFDKETGSQLRLLTDANSSEGEELPPYKFVAHRPHIKSGLALRGGLARVACWSFLCKAFAIKDWMAFGEVFGMPLRLGKYDAGASREEIAILRKAVADLASDAAAVMPDSMKIELVEAQKAGGGEEIYERLANWLDTQVSRAILGQSATTSGTPGKLGADKAQSDVREDIRDDDARALAATINRDLVKVYIDINHGPRDQYPRLVIRQVDREDLQALVAALEKLVPLGLKVSMSEVRDKLGLADPGDDEVLQAAGSSAPIGGLGLNRAIDGIRPPNNGGLSHPTPYTPDQQALERLADQSLAGIDTSQAAAAITQAVLSAENFDDMKEALLRIYPGLDMGTLAAMAERCFFAAQMFGREQAGGRRTEDR